MYGGEFRREGRGGVSFFIFFLKGERGVPPYWRSLDSMRSENPSVFEHCHIVTKGVIYTCACVRARGCFGCQVVVVLGVVLYVLYFALFGHSFLF